MTNSTPPEGEVCVEKKEVMSVSREIVGQLLPRRSQRGDQAMKTAFVLAILATSLSRAQASIETLLPPPIFVVAADDDGCCVYKKSAAKATWECSSHTRRDYCARTARELNITADFYKDKSCSDVDDCK
jgi:hypothetical protein